MTVHAGLNSSEFERENLQTTLRNYFFLTFPMQICDGVTVASLLNTTLVMPTLHLNSAWHDSR